MKAVGLEPTTNELKSFTNRPRLSAHIFYDLFAAVLVRPFPPLSAPLATERLQCSHRGPKIA